MAKKSVGKPLTKTEIFSSIAEVGAVPPSSVPQGSAMVTAAAMPPRPWPRPGRLFLSPYHPHTRPTDSPRYYSLQTRGITDAGAESILCNATPQAGNDQMRVIDRS